MALTKNQWITILAIIALILLAQVAIYSYMKTKEPIKPVVPNESPQENEKGEQEEIIDTKETVIPTPTQEPNQEETEPEEVQPTPEPMPETQTNEIHFYGIPGWSQTNISVALGTQLTLFNTINRTRDGIVVTIVRQKPYKAFNTPVIASQGSTIVEIPQTGNWTIFTQGYNPKLLVEVH